MGIDYKRSMIDREHSVITIGRQCELLGISRSSCYYKKVINPEKERRDERAKALISEIYFETPHYGKRRMRNELGKKNIFLSCKKVKSLMDELGIHALYPKPNLSKPKKENKKYPYLLRNVPITHANQVWSTDILSGPIIMDSPFGRLDPTHKKNITKALPLMSDQIILLAYTDEIDGQTARQVLGSTLKKEYRLRKYGSFHTAIELQ